MSVSELALFLAHSLELEAEAGERYRELGDAMRAHNNTPVAEFFERMAAEAAHHLEEIGEAAAGLELPEIRPWDFDWPDSEAPESASYEAVHYRMSLREAMELALLKERAARDYYAGVADKSQDAETVAHASRFAQEESEHEAALLAMLAEQPDTPAHRREEDDEPTLPE